MFSHILKLLFTVTEQLLEMNSTQFKFNCQSKQNILIWNISNKKSIISTSSYFDQVSTCFTQVPCQNRLQVRILFIY